MAERKVKSYFYRTWDKDRCGCARCTSWNETLAHSKAEIVKLKKRYGQVEVLSEEQMKARNARWPHERIFFLDHTRKGF